MAKNEPRTLNIYQFFPIVALAGLWLASCSPTTPATLATHPGIVTLKLTSTAFTQGDPIPARHTCTGENVSPPLTWDETPDGTRSFALIMDDPDAPGGTWVHWVLFNVPAQARRLPEGTSLDILPGEAPAESGHNSWGNYAYGGPCHPSGTHRYFFKFYALDTLLDLPSAASVDQLNEALQGHTLGYGELMGTYQQ